MHTNKYLITTLLICSASLTDTVDATETSILNCILQKQSPVYSDSPPTGSLQSGNLKKYSSTSYSLNIGGWLVNTDYGGIGSDSNGVVVTKNDFGLGYFNKNSGLAKITVLNKDQNIYLQWQCKVLSVNSES